MDGWGRYLDNIFIETLWRSLKQEALYLHEVTDSFQAKRIIKVNSPQFPRHLAASVFAAVQGTLAIRSS